MALADSDHDELRRELVDSLTDPSSEVAEVQTILDNWTDRTDDPDGVLEVFCDALDEVDDSSGGGGLVEALRSLT